MTRKIVIFADGTGKTVGGVDSNALRLCRMLSLSAEANQVAIYDPGVGTTVSVEDLRAALPEPVRVIDEEFRRLTLFKWVEKPFGYLFGAGTQRNMRRLYRALICVYEPGDEIFLFGFSRGAFTVRALAGVSTDVACHGANVSLRPTTPSVCPGNTSRSARAQTSCGI